jgi:hypothetical protein
MIYFIQAEDVGSIKIGHTSGSVNKRLAELQTGSPVRLRVIGVMPGTPQDEMNLHRAFACSRVQGEWFHPTRDLILFVARKCRVWPDKFTELVGQCPALASLWERAFECHQDTGPNFCANAVWYGYAGHRGIKPFLLGMVGWEAGDERLRTEAAYDIAYDTIYEALPDCRGRCACTAILSAF